MSEGEVLTLWHHTFHSKHLWSIYSVNRSAYLTDAGPSASPIYSVNRPRGGFRIKTNPGTENPFANDHTVAAIDHDYAIGEQTRYVIPQRGDVVYAYIAAAAVLQKGITFLTSDGAGNLQAHVPLATTLVTAVVAVAEETKTIGGGRERAKVRIL